MEIYNTKIHSEGEESGFSTQKQNFDIPSLEEAKSLVYKVLKWKSQPERFNLLLQFQTIITQQLPKLPSEYIHQMISDKNHCSILMILHDQVIGGSCFRLFRKQQLAEIVFFVIDKKQQSKGLGRRLMEILKGTQYLKQDFLKNQNIKHVLTFADHLAKNFFQKQGFTKHISLNKQVWAKLIKEYSGSSLMQFTICQQMNYLFPEKILERKKKIIDRKMKKIYLRKIRLRRNLRSFIKLRTGFLAPLPHIPVQVWLPKKYPGFQEYKKFSKARCNQTNIKKISIPMQCKDLMYEILNQPETQKFQFDSYFFKKIPDSESPFKGVNYPTIWKKLQNHQYSNLNEFVNDLNSFFFLIEDKSDDDEKKKSAQKLRKFISQKIENLRYLESFLSNEQNSSNRIQQDKAG